MITKFKDAKSARKYYLAGMPSIIDVMVELKEILPGHKDIWVIEWHGEDSGHIIQCPDHPHDCSREGCGVSWSEDHSIGAEFIVDGYIIGRWENFVRGGLGI